MATSIRTSCWRLSGPVWRTSTPRVPAASIRTAGKAVQSQVAAPDGLEDLVGTPTAATAQSSTEPRDMEATASLEGIASMMVASHDAETIVTTFRWPAKLGCPDSVAIVGCFTNWVPVPLTRMPGSGDWVRSLALPPGEIQFKYLLNGDNYQASPCEPMVTDHASKHNNNQRLISTTCTLSWPSKQLGGTSVMIAGDWSSWGELLPMSADASGNHVLRCCLPPGTYHVQFLVDGQWRLRADMDAVHTVEGHVGNVVQVVAPPAFRIYYRTGWTTPMLRVRRVNADGDPRGDWETVRLHNTASRAVFQEHGARWVTATVLADDPMQGLEFVPFSALHPGMEDLPHRDNVDAHYSCPRPGGYKLRHGQVRPFQNANHGPVMLVSDLDGTLVGDGPEADALTVEFGRYWESSAALVGSLLVFNTGRSIGQFQALLAEKSGQLPVPDAVITAVGTKIFLLDREGGTRGMTSGTSYKEDLQWAHMLDQDWDLEVARAAARAAMATSPADAVHWLDDGSEHPHRVALSVRVDAVPGVVSAVQSVLNAAGLKFKVVVSGAGEWRYVDVLSAGAGKLAALEYVRTLFGIPRERCLAAGDSGNDVLMLGGENPAVVVGNAQPELLHWVSTQPQDGRLVLADAPMARGVLEGLARHGLY